MIKVMDWRDGRMIGFTFDEIDKDNLDPELREYIRSIKNDIDGGKYNYKIKSTKFTLNYNFLYLYNIQFTFYGLIGLGQNNYWRFYFA
jgi:hypothetical protein